MKTEALICGSGFAGLCCAAVLGVVSQAKGGGFVYTERTEFLSSGDFNGDGVPDALVLDKASGNARIGYLTDGVLTWSTPYPTGLPGVEALAVGRFRDSNADAIAVTAAHLNRLHFIRGNGLESEPAVLTPKGLGPNLLAALTAPYGTNGLWDTLIIGSQANNTDLGTTLLENWAFVADTLANFQETIAEESYLETANPVGLDGTTTFLGAMLRDTNDSFVVLAPFNHLTQIASRTGLPGGSLYAFGRFNGESLPRFFFYVPGQSNLLLNSLSVSNGNYVFDAGTTLSLAEPIQGVYYIENGSDGVALVRFGDGVQGLTLPSGAPSLTAAYRTGTGGAGNGFTGIIPLGNGNFALLDSPAGAASSTHNQVMRFNGTSLVQLSSGNLSAPTARNTRANVWLFQSEPFVNENALFIASSNAPDWSSSASIVSGILAVSTETDAGPSSGLGNSISNNLGAAPAAAGFALPDQYLDSISFFTYAPPRAPEPMNIGISPPPGLYGGPIQVRFTQISGNPKMHYRLGPKDNYRLYTGAFLVTNDTTIQYYGTNTTGRSRLFAASYQFGRAGRSGRQPLLDLAPGSTNPAPPFVTNAVILSDIGTVFYGRRRTGTTAAGFYGPTPYRSFADSPFAQNRFDYFYLENFENGFSVPGIGITPGWVIGNPGNTTDSVDADDGVIDGLGINGHSFYSGGQNNSLTISFIPGALGGHLPTHVGIVWTDVGQTTGTYGYGTAIFTARDANGVVLGTLSGDVGDGIAFGFTADDRFFGAVSRAGISSFTITMNNSTDWEVDHIQYGYLSPEGFDGTIWAINLDGSSETQVTTGARPRVSKDGRRLAFLREGDPLGNHGNLWVRDLATGYESRLVVNTGKIVGFDWDLSNDHLVFDYNDALWRVGLTGPPVQLPLQPVPNQGMPVVNPVDGRLALAALAPGPAGLYVTPPDASSKQNLGVTATSPMWPAWSEFGHDIVFSDNQSRSSSVDAGGDLWVVHDDGTGLAQISGIWNGLNGFPHGAIYSPNADALVGAGTVFGTNGVWIIPLTADGNDCDGPPILLTSSPVEKMDFVGSIVTAPAARTVTAPALFILLQADAAVVYWSAAYQGFALESAQDFAGSWTAVPGPYAFDGYYFQHREPLASLTQQKFFRLRKVLD